MHHEEELLECPICFEKMTDIAFPLSVSDDGSSCSHSFCMGCMQGIYDLSQKHGKYPQCPICRRTINNFVRNQLASSMVTCLERAKLQLRETRESAQDRDRKLSVDNESMARRVAELEGELVRSNTNSQGEAERSGHMRKMLHLLESEKEILSGHLQDIQKDMSNKVGQLEDAERRIGELEQLAKQYQDDSMRSREEVAEANNRLTDMQTFMREKEMEYQQSREERKRLGDRIVELEKHIERSNMQVKKTLMEFAKVQTKATELEEVIRNNEAQLNSKKEDASQTEKMMREMEARLRYTEAELKKSNDDGSKLERRLFELESAARKSDSERTNNGLIVSQLEDMLNKYKQETRNLEQEKYEYGKKVAELEGAVTKFKIDVRKADEEKIGFKERAWKAERDAEVYRKEMEKMKMEFKEREDASRQGGYLSGFLKKSMTLNPLTAIWGETKPAGPLVRNFADLTFYERRGSKKDSCVWRGASKATGAAFAIKKITDSPLSPQDTHIFREALILKKIDHQFVTKFDGVVVEKGVLYFTYSPFVSMDLDYAARAMKLNALQIKSITYQLLVAVNYLHRQELVHRNIKPTSVLMAEDCSIKLCGFQQARSVLGGQQVDPYSGTQTINYSAPEVVISEFCSSETGTINWKAADIWSVGCIFVALLMCGESLFSAKDRASYLKSIYCVQDCRPTNPSDAKQLGVHTPPPHAETKTLTGILSKSPHVGHPSFRGAVEVLQSMLKYDANTRGDTLFLLQQTYFADVINQADLNRGKDISREVTDNCIPHFINEFCAGVV